MYWKISQDLEENTCVEVFFPWSFVLWVSRVPVLFRTTLFWVTAASVFCFDFKFVLAWWTTYQKKSPRGVFGRAILAHFVKFIGNLPWWILFLRKTAVPRPASFMRKDAIADIFTYELCKIFQNSHSVEYLWMVASDVSLKYQTMTIVQIPDCQICLD